MPHIYVNGQLIHYKDHPAIGESDAPLANGIFARETGWKPTIILSHGFGMDHEMWAHQIEPLTMAGWRVITYDERGWGQTETFNSALFTYWDLANDLICLANELEIDHPVLGGMSQGGFISMRAVLSGFPVSGLVLIDTEGAALSGPEVFLFDALFEQALEHGLDGEVGETLASMLFASEFDGTGPWRDKWSARPVEEWRAAKTCLLERDDIHQKLSSLSDHEILVVHGEFDAAIPVSRGKNMAEELFGLKSIPFGDGYLYRFQPQSAEEVLSGGYFQKIFYLVNGAGHTANLEKPELVNPVLIDFLENIHGDPSLYKEMNFYSEADWDDLDRGKVIRQQEMMESIRRETEDQ